MVYVVVCMVEVCLCGLSGELDVYECFYVVFNIMEFLYFVIKVCFGSFGVDEVMFIGDIIEYEVDWLVKFKVEFMGSI